MVIKALGFDPEDLPKLFDANELQVTKWGTIKADFDTMETNLKGVFPNENLVLKSDFQIYFYNPHLGKRAAELLQGGAVMDRLLQPHESHTNYVLQFMMDYNLQGMNTVNRVLGCSVSDYNLALTQINLSHALFRRGKLHDEYDDMEPIFEPPWKAKRRNW